MSYSMAWFRLEPGLLLKDYAKLIFLGKAATLVFLESGYILAFNISFK